MRFQVPQFIEIEDRLVGQFTLKQFVYVVGGLGLSYAVYRFIPFLILKIALILPILGFSAALAFYRMNGMPFIYIVEAAVTYAVSSKLYIWKKQEKKAVAKQVEEKEDESGLFIPKLSDSKLRDLTWSLDIKESLNPVSKGGKTF